MIGIFMLQNEIGLVLEVKIEEKCFVIIYKTYYSK